MQHRIEDIHATFSRLKGTGESGDDFVSKDSIVLQIWGRSDMIIIIFAGASAEFALSKAVDWLYYTGRLPKDPLGRLFTTVRYAKAIVFSPRQEALHAIDAIARVHADVEKSRGARIPDWAYRDVLSMLIGYSIKAYEVLEKPMRQDQKQEVLDVFNAVGTRMGMEGLPTTFQEWEDMRNDHLLHNFERSRFTSDLFQQYRKHLGSMRYFLLLELQKLILPQQIKKLLHFRMTSILKPIIPLYRFSKRINLDWIWKTVALPSEYKNEIRKLDTPMQ